MWRAGDIVFDLVGGMTSDPVVTLEVSTPDGTLRFMAEPEARGTVLILHGFHAQDFWANGAGAGNSLVLAQVAMERMGYVDPALRERLARLGPIRGIGRVSSGSPAVFAPRLPPGQPMPRTIDATLALARRGLEMLPAKRAIEAVVRDGRVLVDLPMVKDMAVLASELAVAGIVAGETVAADGRRGRESLA